MYLFTHTLLSTPYFYSNRVFEMSVFVYILLHFVNLNYADSKLRSLVHVFAFYSKVHFVYSHIIQNLN